VKTVVIAGAGIIGLATALEFAARGWRVIVLERSSPLQEASWAAAGMLAAADPENPATLGDLSRFSLALYPGFLAQLQRLSGRAVSIHTTRTMQICNRAQAQNEVRIISPSEAIRRVPGVNIRASQAAMWLEEQSLDPRELGQALSFSADAAGIEIRTDSAILSAEDHGPQLAILTPRGQLTADALVVATGAWSASPASDGAEASLHTLPAGSVLPRKGQMLRLRPPDGPPLTTVLRSPNIYIVPRSNGNLIVGATVENTGFDRTIRPDATRWLIEQAAQLWSPLSQTGSEHIEEVWTGIRPGTPDHLPILGSFQNPQVFFATGHYRNGILLAPGTARLITQLVCGEPLAVDLEPFRPNRLVNPEPPSAERHTTAMAL
jgi:glycine oxidase